MKYVVMIKVIGEQWLTVDADSEADAIKKFEDGLEDEQGEINVIESDDIVWKTLRVR